MSLVSDEEWVEYKVRIPISVAFNAIILKYNP